MLIDFSDVLQTNVFVLGDTFMKFCRLLNFRLPIVDPSLYIHRFAARLEFGDKTHLVRPTPPSRWLLVAASNALLRRPRGCPPSRTRSP